MGWRQVVVCLALVVAAGCVGLPGADDLESTLELSVQNDGSTPVDVTVRVAAPNGTVLATETDSISPNVARSFDFTVSGSGRHEATVEGPEFEATVSWSAGTCSRYRGRVLVSDSSVQSSGECLTTP